MHEECTSCITHFPYVWKICIVFPFTLTFCFILILLCANHIFHLISKVFLYALSLSIAHSTLYLGYHIVWMISKKYTDGYFHVIIYPETRWLSYITRLPLKFFFILVLLIKKAPYPHTYIMCVWFPWALTNVYYII